MCPPQPKSKPKNVVLGSRQTNQSSTHRQKPPKYVKFLGKKFSKTSPKNWKNKSAPNFDLKKPANNKPLMRVAPTINLMF